MSKSPEPQRFADGDVYFWIEQDTSIHLKVTSPHGDPVELTAEEAHLIGSALIEAARRLDALDTPPQVA